MFTVADGVCSDSLQLLIATRKTGTGSVILCHDYLQHAGLFPLLTLTHYDQIVQ